MATLLSIRDYSSYQVSSGGLVTVLSFLSLMLGLYHSYCRLKPTATAISIPGCTRLGITGTSNLERQYHPSSTSNEARVEALFVYPVKSCRGVELSTSDVTGLGLKYDRLFSFAQLVSKKAPAQTGICETTTDIVHEWRFITQREFPKLALLETELHVPSKMDSTTNNQDVDCSTNGGCLIIRFPYESDRTFFFPRTETITIKIPLVPASTSQYPREQMTIWKDCPESLNMTSSVPTDSLAKLKYFLGVRNPLGLFRVDNLNLRSVTRSLPKDRPNEAFKVGFADAFPVHLLSLASVRALDPDLPSNSTMKGKLDARRFRANVYISGPPAYAEDRWMRIIMGQVANPHHLTEPAQYHVSCRTARCTLPNVHPGTGLKDRNEPHATMKRVRQVDEGAKPHPCLGLSMIPLFGKGEISVGDEIKVLETGELVYEKMFK